eukprot:957832-Prorocentrum_minimum.AAC.1
MIGQDRSRPCLSYDNFPARIMGGGLDDRGGLERSRPSYRPFSPCSAFDYDRLGRVSSANQPADGVNSPPGGVNSPAGRREFTAGGGESVRTAGAQHQVQQPAQQPHDALLTHGSSKGEQQEVKGGGPHLLFRTRTNLRSGKRHSRASRKGAALLDIKGSMKWMLRATLWMLRGSRSGMPMSQIDAEALMTRLSECMEVLSEQMRECREMQEQLCSMYRKTSVDIGGDFR